MCPLGIHERSRTARADGREVDAEAEAEAEAEGAGVLVYMGHVSSCKYRQRCLHNLGDVCLSFTRTFANPSESCDEVGLDIPGQ